MSFMPRPASATGKGRDEGPPLANSRVASAKCHSAPPCERITDSNRAEGPYSAHWSANVASIEAALRDHPLRTPSGVLIL
eukprot:8401270-Pyramimonas_sp.AAC.1